MATRTVRIAATFAGVALIAGAMTAPAGAAKKLKCSPYASTVEGAAEAPLAKITPKHTEEAPLVIEFEHAMSGPAAPEDIYNNIQVFGPSRGLYIREEFEAHSDIDLYLLDAAGEEIASSGAFNQAPIPGLLDAEGNGGTGFESINGLPVSTCAGYTVQSHAYLTPGTPVTMKIWLGEVKG